MQMILRQIENGLWIFENTVKYSIKRVHTYLYAQAHYLIMKWSFSGKIRIFAEFSFLYFLQGMPYGFQVKYLPLLMRQHGHELSRISLLNLVSLPWIMKFSWAKLFDRFENYERFWISGCLMFLSLISASFSMGDAVASVLPLLFLLMSFLSASLDIAVDIMAIRSFEEWDLGYYNIGHIVGYKFGILFGGGMLSIFNSYISLYHFTIVAGLVYFSTACYFFFNDSTLYAKTTQLKQLDVKEENEKNIYNIKDVILWAIASPKQLWLLMFVFFYKVGEQGFASIYPLHLIDKGMTLTHIGFITGIIGQIFSIAGSSFGGFIISKYRLELNPLLLLVAFLKCTLLVIYTLHLRFITSWVTLHAIVEASFQLLAGMMTTATFTIMMVSSKRLPAEVHTIHFPLVSAFEVLGKLCMKSSAGTITELIGYKNFFGLCCFIESVVVLMAFWNAKSVSASSQTKKY